MKSPNANPVAARKVFDVYYADSRTAVVMDCDLRLGWRRLQKTWGFHASTYIPYRDELKIRGQLTLIAQPAPTDAWAQNHPSAPFELESGVDEASLADGRLRVKIPLLPATQWTKTRDGGRPLINSEWLPLVKLSPFRWYDLRCLIVVHEGRGPAPADVRVWVENKLLVPGGRVESKRSRH